MYHSSLTQLSTVIILLLLVVPYISATCNSFGVDFVDDHTYFINTLSDDNFTSVTEFKGCNKDAASVLLVDPANEEYLCSDVPTTPADTPQLSTCPIRKSQMVSGEWIVLVIGNNGDGDPYAWERDLSLNCGPQATVTFTPTVTFNITTTPVITSTVTSFLTITSTIGPLATTVIPSVTAKVTSTITPAPITTSSTKTFTRQRITWSKDLQITTVTETASCTLPPSPSHSDKTCTYSPTLLHPSALITSTSSIGPRTSAGTTASTIIHRYMQRTNRAVNIGSIRDQIEAAKLRRKFRVRSGTGELAQRAPDAPTLTVTAQIPVNTTSTATALPITTTEGVLLTSTTTSILPPATIYSGTFTSTVTLPTPTKTRWFYTYTTALSTKTIHATWTRTTTVTPSASLEACKKLGGHIGSGRI